jgi:hypothetical protein
MPADPLTIVSARYPRAPLAGKKIVAWLNNFDRILKKEALSRGDVCALVADVVSGKIEQRWVGEAKFADMLLWLACRSDAGVLHRISTGAASWDFRIDVYPWGEVDVWMSGSSASEPPRPQTAHGCA